MTEQPARPDTSSVGPDALAVDALSDDVRVGSDSPDETGVVQMNPGELAVADDEGDGVEEHDQDVGDTTVRARQADDLLDPPGPTGGREGQGADGDTSARNAQAEHGGP